MPTTKLPSRKKQIKTITNKSAKTHLIPYFADIKMSKKEYGYSISDFAEELRLYIIFSDARLDKSDYAKDVFGVFGNMIFRIDDLPEVFTTTFDGKKLDGVSVEPTVMQYFKKGIKYINKITDDTYPIYAACHPEKKSEVKKK